MMRRTRIGMFPAMLWALLGCQREPAPAPHDFQQRPRAAEGPAASEASDRPGTEAKAGLPASAEGEAARARPAFKSRLRTDAWDFGIIAPRTELRHRYTIRNNSASTWTIKQATPSCSCTFGEFTSRTIKPSASTSLEVVFRAGNRDGGVHQAVLVELAETDAPLFYLVMKGEIRGLLSPSPPSVDLGRVSAGVSLSRSVHLRNYSDQDVTITRIEAPDWLQTEHQPVLSTESSDRPRQTWKITVHADVSKFNAGAEAPALVVHTSAAKFDPIVIPVSLDVRAPLEVVPNSVDFRIVPVGQTGQQALMLDVAPELGELTEKDLVLTHNLGEELEIQVFKMAAQNRFRLIGIFRPKRSTGAVQGELEIKVRGKTAPPARVAISALVR